MEQNGDVITKWEENEEQANCSVTDEGAYLENSNSILSDSEKHRKRKSDQRILQWDANRTRQELREVTHSQAQLLEQQPHDGQIEQHQQVLSHGTQWQEQQTPILYRKFQTVDEAKEFVCAVIRTMKFVLAVEFFCFVIIPSVYFDGFRYFLFALLYESAFINELQVFMATLMYGNIDIIFQYFPHLQPTFNVGMLDIVNSRSATQALVTLAKILFQCCVELFMELF